jgi:hypothetical protein
MHAGNYQIYNVLQKSQTHQLTNGTRKRIKQCSLNESEVMTIGTVINQRYNSNY